MIKPVLILAGGFGTRLKSAVPDLPKPLAPVKGRPFLLYLLDNLINQGARTFIILLHHQAELIKSAILEYIDQSETLSLSVKFVIEKEPLGTGGAINNAIKIHSLTGSFIVLNGDTWLSGGLEKINNSPINSIAAVKIEDTSRYGALCLSDSFVVSFREKVFSDRAGYINAGMYHLEPKKGPVMNY